MSSPDSHHTLAPGTLVAGKLRIVRVVGSGGMGVVYEVEHELTKHRRALKVLHARVVQQPSVLERFVREASAAARIGNVHVAETFDAGRLESGEPYLLMELVDGETLDQRLERQGALAPGEIADLIHQACEGIQAAHNAGIVHRDLKPENLIVTMRDGAPFVKILDFGISKFDTERTGTLGITVEGLVMGTPYYMSPEQVRGASLIDARTDIYALGIILYECACGARPYDARSIEALAVLIHEGQATPLSERRPTLATDFCAIVHRAMAKDRDERFGSAWALGEALAPWRVRTWHAPITSAPPPRAVVRPSANPAPYDGGPVSSVVPSTDAALAATMGSAAPRRRGRTRALRLIGAASFLTAAGAVAVVVTRFSQSPGARTPPLQAVATESAWPPAVELSPQSVASAAASAAARQKAEPPRVPAAAPSGTTSARPDALAPAPFVPATSKNRVDQTGLAGENPFR